MKVIGRVSMGFSLIGTVQREGDHYLSHCPALNVYSQGDTEKEAMDGLKEATELFLETCLEMGTLDRVLNDSGFKTSKRVAVDPFAKKKDSFSFTIPFELLTESRERGNRPCRA